MSARALSFGSVAESYEQYRPGYPEALADLVLGHAARPVRTALEIGAGTGKASRLFAGRGIDVTATEPDEGMLAELRRRVPANVTAVRGAFEELEPGPAPGYDLVYAAAALHWTRPEGRWPRIAGWLASGGVFASWGGPFFVADPAVEEAVRRARQPFLDRDDVPSPDGTPPEARMQWPGTELLASDRFTAVEQHVIERRLVVRAADYVGYLSTVSAYLGLPAADRAEVFRRILQVLPDPLDMTADVIVHLARRV
jgi:SAM-dependent methyltransferase